MTLSFAIGGAPLELARREVRECPSVSANHRSLPSEGKVRNVAAGTGFAVPKCVQQTLRATKSVGQHPLPKRISHNRTYIVWNGDPSPSLHGLLSLLASVAA
jgi:hypothetical protein